MIRLFILLITLISLAGCDSQEVGEIAAETATQPAKKAPLPPHELTEIPFDINRLTEEQRRLIRLGNESDPTPYLMRSRPIVCQIVETVNNADEVRRAGPITQPAEVMIYAQGEADGDRLVDYGWLKNVNTGTIVWKMTFENSEYAGGDLRNRKSVTTLWLEPGTYELHYVSNGSHALGDWQGAPPERELFYGVVVFNLAAIQTINERLEEAGIGLN